MPRATWIKSISPAASKNSAVVSKFCSAPAPKPHRTRLSARIVFFFNDTSTTEIYTLSLHDALPTCGIEHVVVFMMENRSFDHLLGWLPGADARQAGLTYADGGGVPHGTFPQIG